MNGIIKIRRRTEVHTQKKKWKRKKKHQDPILTGCRKLLSKQDHPGDIE